MEKLIERLKEDMFELFFIFMRETSNEKLESINKAKN